MPIPLTNIGDSFYWGFTIVETLLPNLVPREPMTTSHMVKIHGSLIGYGKLMLCLNLRSSHGSFVIMHSLSRANLLRKGIHVDPICSAFLTEIGNIDHLFVGCPMVKKIWDLPISHNWLPFFSWATTTYFCLGQTTWFVHCTKYFSNANSDSPMEYLEES